MSKGKIACILPHKHEKMDIPETNSLMSLFKVICPSHGRYMLGLEERAVRVNPSRYQREFYKRPNPKGVRHPSLFAAQSWKHAGDCDNIVFKENEYVLFSTDYAQGQIQRLNNSDIDLRDPNAIFINTPLTKYLRYACVTSNVVADHKSWNTFQVDFKQLQSSFVRSSAMDAVLQAILTYISNMYYPYSSQINLDVDEKLKNNSYLSRIVLACKTTHVKMEQYKKMFSEYYESFFTDINETQKWSGFHWLLVNAIDVPIGLDFNIKNKITPGGCPEIDSQNKTPDNFHWYRETKFIPNLVWVPNIGFKATRNIMDKEELVAEPIEDNYMQVTLWNITHYGLVEVDNENENKLGIKKLPEPYIVPDLYKREVTNFFKGSSRLF